VSIYCPLRKKCHGILVVFSSHCEAMKLIEAWTNPTRSITTYLLSKMLVVAGELVGGESRGYMYKHAREQSSRFINRDIV
jgi:hypothetical protein